VHVPDLVSAFDIINQQLLINIFLNFFQELVPSDQAFDTKVFVQQGKVR
jgi:hypothetical protein